MKSLLSMAIVSLFALAVASPAQQTYRAETEKWRAEHATELRDENGWLTVVGLFWLKEGKNTVGSGAGYDIELTDSFKRGKLGEVDFHNGRALLRVGPETGATADGKAFTMAGLDSDEKGKPTMIRVGTQTFYLIKREERFGIRLKDSDSPARRGFTSLSWYPIDPAYRVTAKFEKYAVAKDVLIPNVLGGDFKMKSQGLVHFRLKGRPITLEAIDEGDGKLFIIFRDVTSRTTTYGAGRFLYADKPEGDSVVLDFNRAENPPCAFTSFATCPLPPQQNRLQIAIGAGEKRYGQVHR